MNSYLNILDKLKAFTKKYYTKVLIKGILFFLVLGLLGFFLVMGVEYFLWLNSTGRLWLLLALVAIELTLLARYILLPLFYLFKLRQGISNKQASILIGRHFPEVGDKLYNLLELAEDSRRSELLLASIEQRSVGLNPIPFAKAVNFRENMRYAKYLLIPLALFGMIWVSGNLASFFGSAGRVVNYDLAYEPPAPFNFKLLTNTLDVLDTKAFTLHVTTLGVVRPEVVYIVVEGKEFLLQKQDGVFQYTFIPPLANTVFYFLANGIKSREYTLNALKAPAIQDFRITLDYPIYTERSQEVFRSTGNATIPEGTKVTWAILGAHTESIDLITKDTVIAFLKEGEQFGITKRIYNDFQYEIVTSNRFVNGYERLGYLFNVIKDAYPTIKARQLLDSLNPNVAYYVGEASDDYKLSSIKLICYPDDDPQNRQVKMLGNPNANFDQFYYTFPSGLQLVEGKNYSFYFEATDNDAIHKGKSSKSQVFSLKLLNDDQRKNLELESQQSIISNLDRSLDKFKEQKNALNEISQAQKEKRQLNFNDQKQIKNFLEKQQQQESMMEKFSRQLKENLEKSEKEDRLNQLLQERLERQELEAKKNGKLLEELQKIADKIDKEELTKRLEELGKKQQNNERNLEQLLELTKRYYVTEKAAQLAKDLERLSKMQSDLSETKKAGEESKAEQQKMNDAFDNIAEELQELAKDNQDLKKPLALNIDKQKEEGVKDDQKEALDEIIKHNAEDGPSLNMEKEKSAKTASQKQKSAAQKMKEMSDDLQKASEGGTSQSEVAEDAEMLRQILDNLIIFSFKQENLFEGLEDAGEETPKYAGMVREQQELRELFAHVDDSLFSLSLRQAEISETVNEQITEVYYNIDKSLESIADNQIYQGVSYQKYVLNAANTLADFLADLLDNMQNSMKMGNGSGESQDGFQLPDIIKAQGELKEKMDGMGKSGQGKPGGEGEGQQGEGNQQGEGGSKAGKGEQSVKGTEGKAENGKESASTQGKNGQGQGKGSGNNANGQGGQGQGEPSEAELREIYEIYKEQQQLRELLEKQLQDMIKNSDRKLGEKLLLQMENFENDLLENGITKRSLSKMNSIQYELLKLENAELKQGKKSDRESNSNREQFVNPITTKPGILENYRNEIEILNRQALPLRQNFQDKVKAYFKRDD